MLVPALWGLVGCFLGVAFGVFISGIVTGQREQRGYETAIRDLELWTQYAVEPEQRQHLLDARGYLINQGIK